MSVAPTIVAYISGHGYGHAARTGLVLKAIRALAPDTRIVVRSTAPAWMFPPDATCVRTVVDVGVIQIDSLTPLIDETVSRAHAFELQRPNLVASEAAAIAPLAPTLIVADIPAVAFDVAAEVGVRSVAIGNFGWAWIYRHIGSDRPEVAEIVDRIARSEARASLLLRLPLHEEMAAFPNIEDVPLLAHVSHADAASTRERIFDQLPRSATRGLGQRPLALLSFGGMGLQGLDIAGLAQNTDVTFVFPNGPTEGLPDNAIVVTEEMVPYHDLLAACDVVVMKPGYGTVADCLANRVPMVYATRPGFEEERILIRAMHEMGRAAFVPTADLLAGRLGPAIEAALSLRTPWSDVPDDGAEQIATRILNLALD